jgi:tetratricopeptide (TPR) repeat protein
MRALGLIRLGRFWGARRAAAHAQGLDPEHAYGHAIAGWAQLATGRRKVAREHLREALRSDPHNELAQQGLWRADEWAVFAAALVLETETHPRWLRAAAILQAASVSLAAMRGPDAVGPLLCSLLLLLMVEAWTLPVRFTARGRARMEELRMPGALPPPRAAAHPHPPDVPGRGRDTDSPVRVPSLASPAQRSFHAILEKIVSE